MQANKSSTRSTIPIFSLSKLIIISQLWNICADMQKADQSIIKKVRCERTSQLC